MYYVYIIHLISILSKFFSKNIYKSYEISKIKMMSGLFVVFGILKKDVAKQTPELAFTIAQHYSHMLFDSG